VRQVRKPSQPEVRGPSRRPAARRGARGPVPGAGKRAGPPGLMKQLLRAGKELFSFRHPMLLMSVGLIAATLIVAVVLSGAIGRAITRLGHAADAMVADAGFGPARLQLTGLVRTPRESVAAALGFAPGRPVFDADLFDARARLLQLPWVKEASVRRRYPDGIEVAIVEKQPFALWQGTNAVYVIERSGGLIAAQQPGEFAHLPRLSGEGAPAMAGDFVACVLRHPAVSARVAEFQYQSERRWNLLLAGGVTVKMPEYGWDAQLATLERLIAGKAVLDRNVAEIDLRSPSHYFFVYRRPADQPEEHKTDQGHSI
jgi:cell division protein FtsQ